MTPAARSAVAAVCLSLALVGCSGDADGDADRASDAADRATATASAAAGTPPAVFVPTPGAASAAPTATLVPAPGTTRSGVPSATSPTPVSTAPPGPRARTAAAAPGSYTHLTSGTFSSQLGEQPVDGEATLRVDPPTGDDQHSLLSGEQGSTEQTVRFTPAGVELVQLKLSSPAFAKEFRPVRPVLLFPQPATIGRSWSWTVVSTDNATTATLQAKIARTEVVVIGGERVATVVVHGTLTLRGDIEAVTTLDSWVSERYRLSVKEHAVTDGTVQGFTFHSDVTSTLRSTRPAKT